MKTNFPHNMYDANDNYRFLPKIFRDWHDQKRLFKDIYNEVDLSKRSEHYNITWTQMHTNTIDVFLYQMAMRGYTLQKDDRFKIYDDPIEQKQS